MSIDELWRERKWLRMVFALLFTGISAGAFLLLDGDAPWQRLIQAVSGSILGTSITVVAAYAAFRGVSDKDRLREDIVSELRLMLASPNLDVWRAELIEPKLTASRKGTSAYLFIGNSGRHFTSVTLPALCIEARSRRVSISVQLLDPEHTESCQDFARQKSALGETVTLEDVRQELRLSILTVWEACRKQPGVALQSLTLRSLVTRFRVDCSDKSLVLTTEGKSDPAIAVQNGNHWYDQAFSACQHLCDSGRKVRLDEWVREWKRFASASSSLDVQMVERVLAAAEVDTSQDEAQSLLAKLTKGKDRNPYK